MLNNIVGLLAAAPSLNSYESIATVTVGSGGSATVSFSSIPSTFKHLQIRGTHRSDAASSGNNVGLYMRFNSDTGSNYNWHELAGNGSGTLAYGQADSGINASPHGPRSGDTANVFNAEVIDILDYTDTNKNTTTRALAGDDLNGSGWIHLSSGLWRNTAAITTITLFVESSNIAQYSSFALYGIKG
jgi:hypothetical protein